ncbi:cytochrome c [Salinisphaera sp. T31B1]|uniref:SorU family sulfite dehydrogenase c-type cytochrome subunit n=1 Tax=Salinisphaera sp. T31B1 TaxID=727963 RepID=UPI00333F8669
MCRSHTIRLCGSAAAILLAMSATALAEDAASGKKIFTEQAKPSCTVCHTLSDAGSQGQIGPNLDDLKPSRDRVYKAVTGGVGAMPPYKDALSDAQRRAVADYVSQATGGG